MNRVKTLDRVDDDPESVVPHLAFVGVPVERDPVIKRGACGPITPVYCRDPGGSLIEIARSRRDQGLFRRLCRFLFDRVGEFAHETDQIVDVPLLP
ncbi:hypothetical protein AME01nite_28190 [Acidomonas methanolica NBRC 104435]|nr:hypothetical protein EDC31_13216 [Acidomonas methanolica]GEL00321.1 hypothetical protein AME01nite_28190 [Acidomonas methanolica NBRC 104435]